MSFPAHLLLRSPTGGKDFNLGEVEKQFFLRDWLYYLMGVIFLENHYMFRGHLKINRVVSVIMHCVASTDIERKIKLGSGALKGEEAWYNINIMGSADKGWTEQLIYISVSISGLFRECELRVAGILLLDMCLNSNEPCYKQSQRVLTSLAPSFVPDAKIYIPLHSESWAALNFGSGSDPDPAAH